jgi:hypothetical protein
VSIDLLPARCKCPVVAHRPTDYPIREDLWTSTLSLRSMAWFLAGPAKMYLLLPHHQCLGVEMWMPLFWFSVECVRI